eukprot:6863328-Heterocapsa_arctica.AAC.1
MVGASTDAVPVAVCCNTDLAVELPLAASSWCSSPPGSAHQGMTSPYMAMRASRARLRSPRSASARS